MMIKKLMMMSSGVVLGSMITTASFAWPASDDCVDARSVHSDLLAQVRDCRDNAEPDNCNLRELRACKRESMNVARLVCSGGSYGEAGVPERFNGCSSPEPEPEACTETGGLGILKLYGGDNKDMVLLGVWDFGWDWSMSMEGAKLSCEEEGQMWVADWPNFVCVLSCVK